MFRSLKEKLKLFRKKATEELEQPAGAKSDSGDKAKKGKKSAKGVKGKNGKMDDIETMQKDQQIVKPKLDKPDMAKKPSEPGKIPKPKKTPEATQKIARKRSRSERASQPQQASLKRIIEKETADSNLWAKAEKQSIPGVEDTGWFAKTISEGKLDNILWDLEVGLLESDVALPVIEKVKSSLKTELLGIKIKRGSEVDSVIEIALRNAVIHVLQSEIIHFDNFVEKHEKPVRLMFVGVNGTGKTSAIAKIAFRLKKQKKTCVIAAGDTFRAGAIEQLEKHANKLGIKLIKDKVGSDPAAIAYDSIEHAKARHKDVVLIDTAGRMQTNINLMDEMRKIKRVANPDMIIFVGDSLAGNDVVDQAIQFEKVVGIDAAILTKLDADAKGGAALSIAHAVGKPIIFISVGQRYGDLVPFNPEWMVNRLFE